MKNKKNILTIISICIFFCSFKSENYFESSKSFIVEDKPNYLALYGEYIFKRESCNNCHTFNQTKDTSFVSLDGLKGKYPASWHYNNFIDPQLFAPDSKMPPYFVLFDQKLNQSIFKQIYPNQKLSDWELLLSQAKLIQKSIQEDGETVESDTEVLALIEFLNNIPQSKELQKLDSLKNIQMKMKESIWLNEISDDNSGVYKVISDKNSSIIGKEIFKSNCAVCHGENGEGMIGPNLTDSYWLSGGDQKSIIKSIVYGNPEKGSIPWAYILEPKEVGQLVGYINSIKGSNPKNAKPKQGIKE
ncbi:hypothetical protein EGI22_22075 [Lacihabitans sp. LS3-19]|uniref:c-type cytochrome n=1 Tax=Lacihabitans sp. LS3-19 TaxID=2487335 RepID=UPI0020CC5515|nr:c-type cytochrome [Lacihabitans sp. LS3-19]MCP9770604.1 hypothetical protein [Lacihabitans sp. LS3-19]